MAEQPVDAWSTNWLAYSRFDGVVVTAGNMRMMPSAVRAAIIRYVQCGGSLLVLGDWKTPETWRRWLDNESDPQTYYVGFGQCLVSSKTNVEQLNAQQAKQITESWSKTRQPWRQVQGVADANRAFPVVENLSVPVRGMFILMLAFAITIGPVNIIFLSRKRKRIWMLWTIPAISALTCLAVFAYSLISEGLTAHVRTEGITILDEASRTATTIGMTAFYSALTPGEGLHFDHETELTPQIQSEYWDWGEGGGGRTIDWTHDQHLASGWIKARVPAHFMLRKGETRRERLAVRSGPDGSLTAVNGLGADIRQLWFADQSGNIHSATSITAGAEAPLSPTPASSRAAGAMNTLRDAYTYAWITKMMSIRTNPAQYLRPGCYIALLEGSPFIENGLKRAKPRKCRSIVFGITKGTTDES
jgi:hypothetical protein